MINFENRKIKKGIKMLKKTMYRCRSYDDLEKLGIEDIMTSERKFTLEKGEYAIIIRLKLKPKEIKSDCIGIKAFNDVERYKNEYDKLPT